MKNKQRGTSLLEALITFLVLSVGMLTLARVQTFLRDSADAARQRSEAVRLAQQDLERLRGFVCVLPTPGLPAYGDIVDGSADVTPTDSNTRYTLTRMVQTSAERGFKEVQVKLRWIDRNGKPQGLQLDTLIAAHDPVYAGLLAVSRP